MFTEFEPKVYKRRWFMLTIFCSLSALNGFQWLHLNIVHGSVIYFWNGSLPSDSYQQTLSITWLSMVYMLVYIPGIFPATWFLNKYGLKKSLIISGVLNMTGAWIKCLSMELSAPVSILSVSALSSFAILMTGQIFCAIAQLFILGIPAQLAATWFKQNQLAIATSIGVFGNQIGNGFGMAIPPLIVPAVTETDNELQFFLMKQGFRYLLYGGACVITADLFLIVFGFENEPKIAPSHAQNNRLTNRLQNKKLISADGDNTNSIVKISNAYSSFSESSSYLDDLESMPSDTNYKASVIRLLKSRNFLFLNISYGVNTGVFYAIGTLLSVILLEDFPTDQVAIGWIGFTMVVAGMVGSIIAGISLDITQHYKIILVSFYVLSVLSYAFFTGIVKLKIIGIVFFAMFLLGFFQSGYLPLGFEFAAETTYPEDEGLSSGLLNTSAQIFGIFLTLVSTVLQEKMSGFVANLFMLGCMAATTLPTVLLKEKLKRQAAQHAVFLEIDKSSNL